MAMAIHPSLAMAMVLIHIPALVVVLIVVAMHRSLPMYRHGAKKLIKPVSVCV